MSDVPFYVHVVENTHRRYVNWKNIAITTYSDLLWRLLKIYLLTNTRRGYAKKEK